MRAVALTQITELYTGIRTIRAKKHILLQCALLQTWMLLVLNEWVILTLLKESSHNFGGDLLYVRACSYRSGVGKIAQTLCVSLYIRSKLPVKWPSEVGNTHEIEHGSRACLSKRHVFFSLLGCAS